MNNKYLKNHCKLITWVLLLFVISCSNSNVSDSDFENNEVINPLDQQEATKNSAVTCPAISTTDFCRLGFSHKIRIQYNPCDLYGFCPVVSWESNDPQTTTLDYDGGNWAYFHNNGHGFLDIKLTLSVGGTNCVYTFIIDYNDDPNQNENAICCPPHDKPPYNPSYCW